MCCDCGYFLGAPWLPVLGAGLSPYRHSGGESRTSSRLKPPRRIYFSAQQDIRRPELQCGRPEARIVAAAETESTSAVSMVPVAQMLSLSSDSSPQKQALSLPYIKQPYEPRVGP